MRRGAPRPVGAALDGLTAALAPATLLAEVQRAWPEAAGDAFAGASEPVAERGAAPLMLLDDVTSELDTLRRERLVDLLREGGGQSVIATTDLGHVPGGDGPDVARLVVAEGSVRDEVAA